MPDFLPVTAFMQPDPNAPAVRPDTVLIAIFHYNRADHLRLLMESVERNAPAIRIAVFDDGSTDPDAVALLRALAGRHSVFVNRSDNNAIYLRGLHANMNAALDYAAQHGIPYVFFVQEDQQFVRPLDDAFFSEVDALFRGCSVISQVVPMFFKGFFPEEKLRERYGMERDRQFYYENVPGYGIADIGIASVGRLTRSGFRFSHSEGDSGLTALRHGFRVAFNRNPVLMYTPWPRTTRDHPETVKAFSMGVNPFDPMTEADIQALLTRPLDIFPVAEAFLRANPALRRPWWYTAVNAHSMAEYANIQKSAGRSTSSES